MDDQPQTHREMMHAIYDDLEERSNGAVQAWYEKARYDAGLENIRRRQRKWEKEIADLLAAHPEAKDWKF